MSYQVTLLRGREWYARGNKEYAYAENGTDIVKVSDFKLGKEYDYESVGINSLPEYYKLLRRLGAARDNVIRIHGVPRPDKLFLGGPFERNKRFFQEPAGGITLFNFDIDDWPCEVFDYADPKSGLASIEGALEAHGFPFLCGHDMVVLWTQSAWQTDRLRCHLYMLLDAPLPLDTLRSWARAINRTRGRTIDGSVWGPVQPDYVGRRHVVPPLIDPLTEEQRVFFAKGVREKLSAPMLYSEIEKAKAVEQEAQAISRAGGEESYETKGHCWQATIDKSGSPGNAEGDINSWGFRAAAQMVGEYGPDYVRSNLQDLASRLWERAWQAIERNAPDRGSESDLNTYGVERYAQYLRSACDRDFGGAIDRAVSRVFEAISVAKETETFTALLDKDTLSLCSDIAKKRPAAWAEIQAAIKSELRGKISITEFRKLVQGKGALEGGGDIPDEGRVKLIRQVLSLFDWIVDEDNNRYVGRVITDANGMPERYELKSLSDSLENVFYHVGAQIDETVTPYFGRSCLSYIVGSLHGGAPPEERARWIHKKVGQQQVIDRQGVLWWRLDDRKTLRIDPKDGISETLVDTVGVKSPILWYAHQDTGERSVAKSSEGKAKEDIDLLWKYVLCDSIDRPQVLGWLVTCLLDSTTQMILELIGPPGCAKSSAGSALRDLVEPVSDNPFYFDPKERKTFEGQNKQDQYRAIKKNAVIFLDNVSGLDSSTQDFYCRICTGFCVDLRIMYASVMEAIPLKRPIILTGLNPMITKPDLLSRSLRVHFSKRAESHKGALPESELPEAWQRDRPIILRALAEICLQALKLKQRAVGRRGSYTTIMQAVYGDAAGMQQAAHDYKRSQTDIVMTNPFCLAFTAFINSQFEIKKTVQVIETPGNIHIMYKKWIESNWGKYLDVPLACGEVVTVPIVAHSGKGNNLLPGTPGGLGALLNKFTHELKEVCGLAVSDSSKQNGVRVRIIRKRILL